MGATNNKVQKNDDKVAIMSASKFQRAPTSIYNDLLLNRPHMLVLVKKL